MKCQIHPQNPRLLCRISQHKPTYSCSSLVLPKSRIHKTTLFASYNNLDQKQPIPNTQVTEAQVQRRDVYNVNFETLASCKLGISVYPDFEYNAEGGRGTGTGAKCNIAPNESDESIISVDFDLNTLYIPPLATTRFLGLPLPSFLRIDIDPDLLHGVSINFIDCDRQIVGPR